MTAADDFFARSRTLLGEAAMTSLAAAHVAIVGVGGVGSWCAEALVRTGVGRLTLVDDDVVAPSNVNRQCPATARTLGEPKATALAARLKEINPACDIRALVARYPLADGADGFWNGVTAVVDAIDAVAAKARLICDATARNLPFVSSMGAARRCDPTQTAISSFDKVTGDGLARALRQRFKKDGDFPKRFRCVWSREAPLPGVELGSWMPVTATFGQCLAADIVRQIIGTPQNRNAS